MIATDMEITDNATVVVSSEQMAADLSGQAVVLDLKGGLYHGLNPVASFMWSRMQQPITVAELETAVANKYDVSPERCKADVSKFLRQLAEAGLIDVRSA